MSLSSPFIRRPGRDHAAQPVDRAGRRGGVHAAAGVAAAAGGLPGISVIGQRCPAPAPRRWRRAWRRRSSARSAPSPASTRSRSSSSQGSTRIIMQFDLGKDINAAAREVQAAINASRSLLPSALPGMPSYRKINPSQAPIMILALTSKTQTTSELYDLASTVLAQKVAQVTGVGDVTVGGGSLPAVRVELQPQRADAVRHLARRRAPGDQRAPTCCGPRAWSRTANGTGRSRPATSSSRAADYQPLIITVPERRAGAAVGRRPRERRRRGPLQHRLLQRQARRCCSSSAGSPTPTSSRRWTRITAQLPALRAFLPAGVDARHRQRPLAEHPRDAARGGADAAHRRRSRHPRRAAVPRPAARGDDPGRRGAGGARRQLRGDVPVGLLAEQPVADGADRRDRPRRGRRDRGAGEHLRATSSAGKPPFAAALVGAREVGCDAALDEPVARGGVRLDPLHGRHRRAAVPRVLDHAGRGDRDLARRLAHADADAVRALARGRDARPAEPVAAGQRRAFGRLRRGYGRIARLGAARTRRSCMLPASSASSRSTCTSTSTRPRASCRSRTPASSAASSAATTACRSRSCSRRSRRSARPCCADPAVESVGGFIGGGRGINNAWMFVRLKPLAERKVSAQMVVERLRRDAAEGARRAPVAFVDQDIRFGGGDRRRRRYEYTLLADDTRLLRGWGERVQRGARRSCPS